MKRIPGRVISRKTRRRPQRLLEPLLEPLEPRGLMSVNPLTGTTSLSSILFPTPPPKNPPLVPIPISSELSKNLSGRTVALYQLSLTKHPLYQSAVGAQVLKVPTFDSAYTGEKRLDLDVIGANARLSSHQGFVLTGKVLGPINPSQPAIFAFLINRGGAGTPGPIQGHPMISYDSMVTVTDGPGGPVGTVSLLNSHQQATTTVALPSSSVQVNGSSVQLTVPARLLPSTVPPGTHLASPRYSYVVESAVPGGLPSDIAGFAPEYANATVSQVK